MNTTIIEFEVPSPCHILKENLKIKIISHELHGFQGKRDLFVMMEINGIFYGDAMIKHTTYTEELINYFLVKKIDDFKYILNKIILFSSPEDFDRQSKSHFKYLIDTYEYIRKFFSEQKLNIKNIEL